MSSRACMSATSKLPSSVSSRGVGNRFTSAFSCCCWICGSDSRLPGFAPANWLHLFVGPSCRASSILISLPMPNARTKTIATDAPNTTRNNAVSRTFASVVSYPGLRSSVFLVLSGSCVGMFRLQNLRQMRIVQWNQIACPQLSKVVDQPQGRQSAGHKNVLQLAEAEMQVAAVAGKIRRDQPPCVPEAGEQHDAADRGQLPLVALDLPR